MQNASFAFLRINRKITANEAFKQEIFRLFVSYNLLLDKCQDLSLGNHVALAAAYRHYAS